MDAEPIALAVFTVLTRHVSYGEIDQVLGQFPRDIQAIFR